jgi:glucose uptake protein GlcU
MMKKLLAFSLMVMGAIQLGLSVRFCQVWWLSRWETMMGFLFGLIALTLIGIGARFLFEKPVR